MTASIWPHLTTWTICSFAGLRVLWKAPDWGLKLVVLAEAIRRFRHNQSQRQWLWRAEEPPNQKP
jgi:hypothetical protein